MTYNGYNQLESLILSDYAQPKYYRETYGNSWFEFTSNYAAMNPGCLNYDNCECTISGTTYLNKLGEYKHYKDQSTFNNAQLITKYYFENAAGLGWVGVVCKTENICANMVVNYGVTSTVVGMGHNFGASGLG
eukprot:209479_1